MSLRTFMDGLEPNFHKGGKYEKYYAIYEMVDTIFTRLVKPRLANPMFAMRLI